MSCRVLQGVMEGFCGCLTTVSTWVAELNGLKREHGYIYGFTSVVVALSFLIVIMGSLLWSRGFNIPVCV
jgi:fluoride exporter